MTILSLLDRPCNASDVLRDLAGAAAALASKQQRSLELCELPHSLLAAVEESSLRQALSNLIEGALLRTRVGGKVEIYGLTTPAGGVLIVIDDNGPDMHYMTQMHTLAPFGTDLLSSGRVEDNMTWNFVAGLAVAREILESYGCVIRVLSPRKLDAALGTGGTRIELWLPDINFEVSFRVLFKKSDFSSSPIWRKGNYKEKDLGFLKDFDFVIFNCIGRETNNLGNLCANYALFSSFSWEEYYLNKVPPLFFNILKEESTL
ncbi:hypothetical protein MA16_Dca027501 [Dendrobium catenatum]|uniref:Histidine kinase/HSP90-like ATPase domain-containing protein n=1 Tax=Dendrobium catenatum TaxID=906689 RepID=A0A2I0VA88_9ASPA|nr:hypothetical protein MA16_Dca027501 [Dendrobium catenatum]